MNNLFTINFLKWLNDHPNFIEEEKKKKELQIITIKNILENFYISKSTIYRMVKSGKFPSPIKIGRRSYWVGIDVVVWMESNKEKYKIPS